MGKKNKKIHGVKIFLDFDDAAFNAKRFKKDFIKVFLKNGVTRQEFENSYYTFQKRAQEWKQYYDPKKQILVLKRKNQIDHKKLERDLDIFLSNLRRYVFSDVKRFLNLFMKKDLFLITYGHVKFQMIKIKGSGLKKFFHKIIITKNNKISKIIEISKKLRFSPDEKIILIDDRPEQLEKSKIAKRRIFTFRIARPEGRYSDLISKEKDWETKNLKEIFEIIKREIIS